MKKRIISMLLALLMVISVLPMPIFAEGVTSAEELRCRCPENYDTTNGHVATCPLYTCPECGGAPWHETCPYSGDIGKYAVLNSALGSYSYTSDNGNNILTFYPEDFTSDAVFIITGWRFDAEKNQLWYKADFYSGGPQGTFGEWSPNHEMLQNDADGDTFIFIDACEICGKPDCTTEHKQCELCGGYDCTKIHFYCEHCESYACTEAHLICRACGTLDCETAHIWCGICSGYDCGIEHVNKYKPITAPVIPANPTLTPGQTVSIADGLGNSVGAAGITLYAGEQISLSAWSDLSGAYQWQIRYDAANDLWANIQGQTGKGILVTPAMVASVISVSGSAAIRCVVTVGEDSYASAAIPVSIGARAQAASEEPESGASTSAGSEGELQTVYVVVTYEYSDGRTAASSDFAQLVPGKAYSHSYPLPEIPGYMATLETNSLGAYVEIQGDNLVMNIPENVLTEAYTVFTIKYVPDFVNYTVIHYWQNVNNDYYAEHERENIDDKYKTGEQVAEAHKSYPGLYNLLYEPPTAAADGSTVVEVYYDRYYYLMKFELGDMGYGVDPVYARYGDALEVATPTRAGYTFRGWSLDGLTEVELPTTVPAENRNYIALWTPGDPVDYTIVYWKENADDTNYSYWTQVTLKATPGEVISGNDSVAPHVTDEQYFTYNDNLTDKDVEIKGNGSTIINVYYNRNYYTVVFYHDGECQIPTHTHGTGCNTALICGMNGHTHNSECVRTLTCLIQEHVHSDACTLQCGLPIHNEHGDACTICEKELHPAHTVDGNCYTLDCDHTHSGRCYGSPGTDSPSSNRRNAIASRGGEPESGYVYATRRSNSNGAWEYHLYLNGTWYDGSEVSRANDYTSWTGTSGGNTYDVRKYAALCEHSHSIENGCYDLTCTKPIHASHSEAEGCYSDVIHTGHTDECYGHASHPHTEDCYRYECGETPHEHDSSCYRECTLYAHTHGNSCRYGGNQSQSSYEIFDVITAKYEQTVGDIWPTAADFPNETFRGWSIDGVDATAVSKRINMTSDLCDTSDNIKKAYAIYGGTKTYLYYMFESFDQTSPASGNDRIRRNGVYYDKSELYYQEVNSGGNWNQKQIAGMTKVNNGVVTSGSNVFLYYTRNRSVLRFHNVNEVEKTVTNIMFEQPLANYTDANGNLLRDYEPPYPEGLEPNAYQFVDWYTTPECFDGTEVDWSTLTMPAGGILLYAKWV
ncbi:MAG: InlB B-repeat-containing protein, partial [Oscillospiraceae bacterium]|nr:InlB B-repeat-containing protein [Oscillospiraceae bacterium]